MPASVQTDRMSAPVADGQSRASSSNLGQEMGGGGAGRGRGAHSEEPTLCAKGLLRCLPVGPCSDQPSGTLTPGLCT